MKRTILFCLFVLLGLSIIERSRAATSIQRERFIQIDGANLKAKLDAAYARGRSEHSSGKFWTAWSFDVRPGVVVDAEYKSANGSITVYNGVSTGSDRYAETRNLGVFVLRNAASQTVERVEVYNLERQREYSGYAVYWLGRANNEESLSYLKSLTAVEDARRLAESSVSAIALHDDPRVSSLLKEFINQSTVERVRKSAVFWLGQMNGELGFLSSLAEKESESIELRKQAVFAIGVSKDQSAMNALQKLWQNTTSRELKKQITFAVSINENKEAATDFLFNAASKDQDRDVRKQAIFWLGQKAGERSLKLLGDVVDSNTEETEVQKQAVFALSQRSKDEAVPALIRIARTHPKNEVRKQAIFWLGQSGDDRAVDFFKELLTK